MTGGRIARVARRASREVAEFVGEAVFEVVLRFLACLVLGAATAGFLRGWSRNPLVTVAVSGWFVVFAGYGALEVFRPARPGRRRGRLASAAVLAFAIALVVLCCGMS